jgi:hypothetical protein
MTERVMNIGALPSFVMTALHSNRVKVSEVNRVITIVPAEGIESEKNRCPLLGIAKDSNLTVEKFLEWKREDREREYEHELRS